ncbi:MAG: hypothetical protein HYU80_03230 [Candidatus Blackburnbacteria bacterium]|nr:hypothetical protein [Candidatus Blackburnbacteria bacterium]
METFSTKYHIFGFGHRLVYLITFFLITPITLATSLFALTIVSPKPQKPQLTLETSSLRSPKYGSRVYAAIPNPIGEVRGAFTTADARSEIIKQYLEKYNSPLLPYAQNLVVTAEKYGLDFRLLVAIAQQESNLCKKIPEDSYNCWGWGIHSKGTLRFQSYPEAIEEVAQGLKEDYFDKGYTTPEDIMKKYTPFSPGTWAAGIQQFLGEME